MRSSFICTFFISCLIYILFYFPIRNSVKLIEETFLQFFQSSFYDIFQI